MAEFIEIEIAGEMVCINRDHIIKVKYSTQPVEYLTIILTNDRGNCLTSEDVKGGLKNIYDRITQLHG